ncbi:MAG: DUF5606 domain-containing protein [Porphyromonadaceae bacterium]|nr:DUF5606 domain-containing protein [Porphyromonadaceae bacterium]
MLKTILSVSGKPGLFRLLSQGKNTLIVESLEGGKRMPIHAKDRVVSLGNISMFTTGDDIALSEVLTKLYEHQAGSLVAAEHLQSSDSLAALFEQILPTYDKYRVYSSDIKKLFSWYNLLISAGFTSFADQDEETAEEA